MKNPHSLLVHNKIGRSNTLDIHYLLMKKIARRIAEGKEEFYCVFAVSFKSCDPTDVICYDFNK